MNVRRPFIRSSGWKLRQKSLRDFLGQANRRALALASARSLAGSSLRDSKPPLAPRPCRTRIQFHGLHESIQNKSPTGLRRRGFYPKQWLEIKAEIAARFPWSGESERPCACQRKVARGLVAARLETPARPSSVPDEDSIPRSAREVFKIKAPPACAGGAFILNTGGGGGNRTLVRKHSTDSSTYLALSFNLTQLTGTCTLQPSELPKVSEATR
jgi:hypothetical protein